MSSHPSIRAVRAARAAQAMQARPALPRGVSLIELMVGMVIGLLATLVIAQVALEFDRQKRNTTAGADAQVNGAVALYGLQRDVESAGYGLTSSGAAGCPMRYKLGSNPAESLELAPVRITDGSAGAPDALTILKGEGKSFSLPLKIKGHFRNATAFELEASTNLGNLGGDLLLAVPQTISSAQWCVLFNVSATPTNTAVIAHDPATGGPWNHDGNTNPDSLYPGATGTASSFPAGSHVINIGTLLTQHYSVGSEQLLLAERRFNAATTSTAMGTATPRHARIVSLQAVYGKDTTTAAPGPYRVATTWDATSPTTIEGWARVVAIRIALVARSDQFEKTVVTPAAPVWHPDGSTPTSISLEHLDQWRQYRYKVFETVVPLRNLLWQS